jgi:hypothetical protein
MGKKRTTIDIAAIKDAANTVFKESINDYTKERKAIETFVTNLLLKHNVYNGFSYLSAENSAPGKTIGVIYNDDVKKNEFPDPTRIRYN